MNIRLFLNLKTIIIALILLLNLLMTGSSTKCDVPILMYHAVNNEISGEAELFVTPSDFEKQIKYLSDNGFTALDFSDLYGFKKYKKPIVITFDDGYADNYSNAYTILKKFNFKATIFLITDLINKPGYLTEIQLKKMSDLISFQSHTLSHHDMTKLKEKELEDECVKSKHIIKGITRKQVIALSYPFGCYNQKVINIASLYYKYAVTTKTGFYHPTTSKFEIKRIGIMRSCKIKDFAEKLK